MKGEPVSKVQVFDPPMCCSTGVCGPEVDPALARFAADLEWLKTHGVQVERFNLSQEPAAFVSNAAIAEAMRKRDDALPLLVVDGAIASQGAYPTREALAGLVGVTLPQSADPAPTACCAPSEAGLVSLSKASAPKKCC
jgi:hypothetical protein